MVDLIKFIYYLTIYMFNMTIQSVKVSVKQAVAQPKRYGSAVSRPNTN